MADSSLSEMPKQPIKNLEIQLNNFNNIVIPHHLNLLKTCKVNIKKYQNLRNWDRVYSEQISASRVVKQLTQLLYELESLREQVIDKDVNNFDKLTSESKTSTLNAIKEYSELQLNLPLVNKAAEQNKELASPENQYDNKFLQVQAEKEELERQEACLEAWNSLQNDIQDLQNTFVEFSKLVQDQGESVDKIESNIEEAQEEVHRGARALEKAAKYKVMTYPLTGALIGTCLGGPIGLFAGLKIGSLAAIGGGLLGFTSGKVIKEKTQAANNCTLKAIEPSPTNSNSNTKKSPNSENEYKKENL